MKQISRRLSRKLLYQRLYADCFNKNDNDAFKKSFLEGKFESDVDEKYIDTMYEIIRTKETVLIHIIQKYAPRFDVKNMHLSYVLPVLIGAGEMLFYPEEIPAKVSINEGVELAKIYSDDSAKKIVNGILNKILENYQDLKKDVQEISTGTDISLFAS